MNNQLPIKTVRAALHWAASYLGEQGIPAPRLDGEILLSHVLKCPRVNLYLDFAAELPAAVQASFRQLVKRRGTREPLQYITGKQEFMSLEFGVNPGVLIPRGDTELLVEKALEWARSASEARHMAPAEALECRGSAADITSPKARIIAGGEAQGGAGLRILDLCTGSGIIAISLAHYLPGAEVWAGDISPAALETARANGRKLGIKVKFALGDLAEPFSDQTFDLVTANPPYIPSEVIEGLEPEVARAEPRLALDGGQDGLEFYRRLAEEVPRVLRPEGMLMLEIGWDQGPAVPKLLAEAGFQQIRLYQDYGGRDRLVTAVWPIKLP